MLNFMKKSLSLFLSTVILITVFSGCSFNYENDDTDNSDIVNSEFSTSDVEDSEEDTEPFVIYSPKEKSINVYDEKYEFSGRVETGKSLSVNGEKILYDSDGYFTYKVTLAKGENRYIFNYGGEKKEYSITYSTPLIKSYTPSKKTLTLDSNTAFSVTAEALAGCSVVAEIGGEYIPLTPFVNLKYDGKTYIKYKAEIDKISESGQLKISAKHKNEKLTVKASKIIINNEKSGVLPLAKSEKKKSVPKVAKVVGRSAETFSGNTIDDYSRPENNYLPYGTVDTYTGKKIYDSESDKTYYLLKSGVRVYTKKSYIKLYKGTLPKTNTVKLKKGYNDGNQFCLKFSTKWRAPFKLTLTPQKYVNTKIQNYNIENNKATFNKVDITFNYTTKKPKTNLKLTDNPLFKKYKWIKTSKGWKFRLYLRKTGKFFGYDSYYKDGYLIISFLKPPTITTCANKYGYSLNGVKIYVDPGHGGSDGGTYAFSGKKTEKYYTLLYAKEIANRLKRLGATVYITRKEDKTRSLPSRFNAIQSRHADLAVSIHFDGSASSSANGFFTGYFNPYTYLPANFISTEIKSKKYFKTSASGKTHWHYFNLSRVSACPVVLSENGFLTNRNDLSKIKNADFRQRYCDSYVDGIMKYFISVGNKKRGTSRVITSSTSSSKRIITSNVSSSKVTSSSDNSETTTSDNPDSDTESTSEE